MGEIIKVPVCVGGYALVDIDSEPPRVREVEVIEPPREFVRIVRNIPEGAPGCLDAEGFEVNDMRATLATSLVADTAERWPDKYTILMP